MLQESETEPGEAIALQWRTGKSALYLGGDVTSSLQVTCNKQNLKMGQIKSGQCPATSAHPVRLGGAQRHLKEVSPHTKPYPMGAGLSPTQHPNAFSLL